MSDALTLGSAVTALVTEARTHVCAHSVLAPNDDEFEIRNPPAFLIIGPRIEKSKPQYSIGHESEYDTEKETFTVGVSATLYDLHFEVLAIAESDAELLDIQQAAMAFISEHETVSIGSLGSLALEEAIPIGGGQRVNLSNLRQATGEWVLRGFPVYDTRTFTAHVIKSVVVDMEADSVTVEETE